MSNTDKLSAAEIAELRSIIDERRPLGGAELAIAYRAAREMDRSSNEQLIGAWWDLVEGKAQLDFTSFAKLLGILGGSIQTFEGHMRAVELQRRAEAQQEADRKQRDAILERARPFQEKLDAATAAIFGADWQQQLNSGDMVEAPYLTDLERGTVVTKIAALREPCTALEKALAGIESCFVYGWKAAPSFLTDAREAFDRAVAAHVERQRIPA